MREAIRDACKKTAHDVEEPLIREIKEARRKLDVLDGDIFRVRNSLVEGISEMKDADNGIIKL
jgi:hypothetical protein